MSETWLKIIELCIPIAVALIPILPTIVKAGKKTRESVEALDKKLDAHIRENQDEQAKQSRVRILRFYDEICEGKKHSENHYEDILEDIDFYEAYCAAHPGFKNNKGKTAMSAIKKTYALLKRENKFLTL